MKIRLLSALYLLSLCVSLPLLWCSSRSMRAEVKRLVRGSVKRRFLLLRVLAKHAARDLGTTVIGFMAVPAGFVGCILQSAPAAALGAAVGFALFTLLPVILPMPSREMADAAATGRRFI
jgi:hypothetical protein